MSLLGASFRGVRFHVDGIRESVEWRHETVEFVSDHDPIANRYKKAPQEYEVSGFLIGKGALLTKELLVAACAEPASGKLIHPLLGLKDVICIGYTLENFDGSDSAYRFSLKFLEAPKAPVGGLLGDILQKSAEAKNHMIVLASKFVQAMEPLLMTAYLVDNIQKDLEIVDGFLRSANGIGIVPAAAEPAIGAVKNTGELLKSIITSPKDLFLALTSAAKKTPGTAFANLSKDLKASAGKGFLHDTLLIAALDNTAEAVGESFLEPIETFFKNAGRNPHCDDDQLFSFVWDKSLQIKPKKHDVRTLKNRPSLVAAYEETGSTKAAEEFAINAKQPFKI